MSRLMLIFYFRHHLLCYCEAFAATSLFPNLTVMAMELSPSLPFLQVACSSSSKLHASRPSPTLAMAAPPSAALADSSHIPSSYSSSSAGVPKMEPFSRSRVSRLIREPPLLEKAEQAISDRCSILEGDDAYSCWEALFEFENLKEELTGKCNIAPPSERSTACHPLERLEHVVRQSGGVTSLINNVRMLAKVNEMRKAADKERSEQETTHSLIESKNQDEESEMEKARYFYEAGSFPPSKEELELAKSAMMPESPFASVLRAMGIPSPWLSQSFGA